jgi:hypothetical protein
MALEKKVASISKGYMRNKVKECKADPVTGRGGV